MSLMDVARNQNEIVEMRGNYKEGPVEEEMAFPGIKVLHMMDEAQLVDFFDKVVLRSRKGIREVKVSLGNYPCKEKQIRVPNGEKLADIPLSTVARAMAMALISDPNSCGMRFKIEYTSELSVASRVYVSVADKPIAGPTRFTTEGDPIDGDKEFKPSIVIVHD